MKKEKFIPKLIFFLLGMAIIQLGVVIFLLSGAGSDPFTVFTQGLSKALSVSNKFLVTEVKSSLVPNDFTIPSLYIEIVSSVAIIPTFKSSSM